jgi:hypothetical protein
MTIKNFFIVFLLSIANFCWAQQPQEKVLTGIQLMNIYDLDINKHSFYADFYLWFKWKGDINPTEIEFINAIEKWGSTRRLFYEQAKILPDGYFYNGMRVEARFYHAFDLAKFPLDKHELNIHIENNLHPADSLLYQVDSNATFMREGFALSGWNILSVKSEEHKNIYRTNLGESDKSDVAFSNFTFKLSIERPIRYFLLKLFLPLLITIFISLSALLISVERTDARISVVMGSLLTAVFLQQSYSSALPDVGYMVLMDKIYLLVYLMIMMIMLRVVWVGRRLAYDNNFQQLKVSELDFKIAIALLLGLLIGIIFLVL